MGSLDPAKILVILVIALVVLGPERLPKAARQLGAAWRELTRVRDQVTEEIRSAIPDLDLPNIPRMPQNMVSGFISDLTRPSVSPVGGDAAGAPGVHTDVEAPKDELYSSSSSGSADLQAGAPSWASESGVAGRVGPESPRSPANEGWRRPTSVPPAVLGDVPVSFDDASMN